MTARTTWAVLAVATAAAASTGCGTKTVTGGESGSSTGSGSGQTSGASTGTMSGSGSGAASGTSKSGSAGASNASGSDAGSGASTGAASGSSSGTSGGSSGSGSSEAGAASCDAGLSSTASAPVGAQCVPEQEYDPSFGGFSTQEVSIESNDFACASRICLVDHFQGRVTCPYGQAAPGIGPDGTPGCLTPGTCAAVIGPMVSPQCSNRQAANAVYCSCRCANENGGTDDAGPYCTCPSDMICTQFALTGAYCVKADAEYDAGAGCSKCDPTTAPCP